MYHIPIMVKEVVDLLAVRPGGVYVDCTLGGGGHAVEILKASSPDGRLIGIDRDREAIETAGRVLGSYSTRVISVHGDFRALVDILRDNKVEEVDGILADLGVSSRQLDASQRGFSFAREGPLDMRMDQESGETASKLIMRLTAGELESLLRRYGEERCSRSIARAIKAAGEIRTTTELAGIVGRAVPRRLHPKRIHVATKTFQALRIAVNDELAGLGEFIHHAAGTLKKGGRIAIISFHSLEDRVVKHAFKDLSKRCICPSDMPVCNCGWRGNLRVITKKAVGPLPEEIRVNPRSRSARLRAAEKL